MNIVVCDDTRGCEHENINEGLRRKLKKLGHNAVIFDGRDKQDRPILNPTKCADALSDVIATQEATGMVYDLAWFKDFDFGVRMLEHLHATASIPVDMVIHVYSKFENEPAQHYHERLSRFGIRSSNIHNRISVTTDEVAALFGSVQK